VKGFALSSSADALVVPLASPTERPAAVEFLAVACFGLALGVGLIGAFVGLDTHSFWFDELFTATLLQPDGTGLLEGGLMARIATDVHPPVYLVLLSLYAKLAGTSDAALRSFSALCACGSLLVFVVGTRRSFSIGGRLFAGALAAGSLFWFFQAQNARSYALGLLIGAAILALTLRLLEDRPWRESRPQWTSLVALMIVGSFVHFYVLYECLAVLIVLGLLRPPLRVAMAAIGGTLLVAALLYVKLVITPFTRVSLDTNWYRNDFDWYLQVLGSCLYSTFGRGGLVALLICAIVFVFARMSGARTERRPLDRITVLLCGVPLLVLAGAIASSTLQSPNFYDRNFLVASPFLWAVSARLYDAATAAASGLLRRVLNAALAVIVLALASIVWHRLPSNEVFPFDYEPYRQSAEWIATLPECRDQVLPVISTDLALWYKPGYADAIYTSGYGRYLRGFAHPELLFLADVRAHAIPADLKRELQRRIDGGGCPVLAWSAHNVTLPVMTAAASHLLVAADRPSAQAMVATQAFEDDSPGFVVYLKRPAPQKR
jgi:hypothetical protein